MGEAVALILFAVFTLAALGGAAIAYAYRRSRRPITASERHRRAWIRTGDISELEAMKEKLEDE